MVGALGTLSTAGCIVLPTREPLSRTVYPGPNAKRPATLVILLPGWGDRASDFARHGFIDAMRRAGVDADVVAVDAHSGCCWRKQLTQRLEDDILDPARSDGYETVWVAGISMGAQGALLAAAHCEDVDGVVLLSPWLGAHPVVTRIEAAGGLQRWRPPAKGQDAMTRIWSWLRAARCEGGCPVYLAHGTHERWRSIAILVDALPRERVVVAPGGHDWSTWSHAWPELLERGAFASAADVRA
jgi:pimeloyl-ACP methyl ester carboxylesterase